MKDAATIAPSTYTALTVSGRTAKVTHLWVGTGNLCPVDFTRAPSVRQLQNNTICVKCAVFQEVFEAAQEAAQKDRERIAATHAARRLTDGQSAVTGWELLYDKPSQGVQVGRRDRQYALICVAHKFPRQLDKLTDERGLRKNGGWCPSCNEAEEAAEGIDA